MAIKSKKQIDQDFISSINNIKNTLSKIKNIESIFTITDAPILISSNLKLNDLNKNTIPTLKNTKIELSQILNEFSKSPIFKNQIISESKKVSALIIYPKIDKEFDNLKKQKNLFDLQKSNNSYNNNKIKKSYRVAKEEFNKNRHKLINEIRSKVKKENLSYEYFLGGIDMIADDTISYVKKDIILFGIFVSLFL